MQLGIKFPTREIGRDRAVIDDWVAAAEDAGYSYLCLNDHVLGVDPRARPEYGALYRVDATS